MKCGVSLALNNDWDVDRFVAAVDNGDASQSQRDGVDNQVWDEEVRLGDLVEPLGYDSVWAFEHHGTPYIQSPDPLQWLSFWAGRTTRIGVGTQLVIVPWHHPVRLAEQLSLLQHMLGDRDMSIGLGRGLGMREYSGLGVDMNESRDRFSEGVEIVQALIGNETVDYQGKFFQVPDHSQRTGPFSMRPRPLDSARLLDSLYGGWVSPSSVDVVAKLGLRPIVLPNKAMNEYIGDIERYRRVRAEVGLAPAAPTICTMIGHCGETEDECREVFELNNSLQAKLVAEKGGANGQEVTYEFARGYHSNTPGYEFYGEQMKQAAERAATAVPPLLTDDTFRYGTPEFQVKWLTELLTSLGAGQLVVQFNGPGKLMPVEVVEKSMRLFAQEVLPAIHDLDVAR